MNKTQNLRFFFLLHYLPKLYFGFKVMSRFYKKRYSRLSQSCSYKCSFFFFQNYKMSSEWHIIHNKRQHKRMQHNSNEQSGNNHSIRYTFITTCNHYVQHYRRNCQWVGPFQGPPSLSQERIHGVTANLSRMYMYMYPRHRNLQRLQIVNDF